jgi:energy-coupling factor transporter transmembrane protein EcfT
MPIILEYEPKDTVFHRMNIFTKLVVVVCTLTLGTFWWDLRFLVPLFLLAATLAYITKIPLAWFKAFSILVALTIPPTLAYVIFMTSPAFFKVLPPEFVTKPIAVITIGGYTLGLTHGNLYWLISNYLRMVIVLIAASIFIYSTSQSDLIDWLRSVKVPEPIIFVVMTALRFFPIMLAQAEKIITAQKLRGWRVTSRNPAKLVKQIRPIAVPITSFVVQAVDRVSISVVTRGFGSSHKPTGWVRRYKMGLFDYIVCIAYPVLTVIALYLLFIHNIGMI